MLNRYLLHTIIFVALAVATMVAGVIDLVWR